MTDPTLTTALASFARTPSVSPDALAVLRLSLLDWMAVAIAGSDEPVAVAVRALAAEEAGTPSASICGATLKVPPRMAAMVNGTVGHALDYDDTHFAHIGHPSTVILPAVLALGQATGAGGSAVQEAALIGVEASVRIGLWLGRNHYQTGFHQTATAGSFGAALACARLLGFDQARTEAVLGLCATRASGLKSQFGTMAKPFNAGLAAANAVEAALLVRHGLVPNQMALEASQGFGETHHGEADLSALDGLGTTWLFEAVSHKFHACCHGLHAALEAFEPFRGQAEQIAKITVSTHPRWLRVCNIAEPTDALACKFSYRQVLAMAAHGQDTAVIENYSDQTANAPQYGAFRQRIEVLSDESLSETAANLTVTLENGTVSRLMHDLQSPMAYADREAKVRGKSAALLGPDRADRIWRMILEQATPQDLAEALTK